MPEPSKPRVEPNWLALSGKSSATPTSQRTLRLF